ncbi:MAG: CapA family protein [Oscillospiraceae bacterium]|nr:CapA family protein [Oscillospiraceae bacterium]
MSIRKFLIFVTMVLFVAAIALSVMSEIKKQQVQEEYTPSVQTVTITAVGDCTLATDINASWDEGFVAYADQEEDDYSYFLRNVAPIFAEDDITIVNFEGTLSNQGEREDKTYAFRGKPEYVQVLTSSSVEAANLANNHSADYGDVSHSDTIKYLNEVGISNFAGTNTTIRDVNGISVGLVGINALEETEAEKLERAIGSVKELGAQLIIVSIHWGIEKETSPTNEQIELAHKAVDLGADLVIGTHPHVLQGIEKYNGRYIAYSLGNFCFGGNSNPADKDTVIYRQVFTFIEGTMQEDDNMVLIPATISGYDEYNNYQPAIATGERKIEIQNKLLDYSMQFGIQSLNFR